MAARAPTVGRQTDAAIAQGRRSADTPFAAIVRAEDPARHLAIARTWAEFYERQAARLAPSLPPAAAPGQRLRIAYLANSFRDHPIAQLMLGLYRRHDREKFHVSAYSYGADDGSRHRRRIAAEVDRFTDIAGLGDAAAAARIRADGIDILIDLNGYIEGARLAVAALRPAPIQIAYLGYPGTTGARFFDYILADRIVAPAEHAAHFAEAACRLPYCYLATDGEQPIATGPLSRADCGLPEDGFVFCSFNQSYKIDAATFTLWMRLLGRVRGSVLWLLRPNPAAERNLRAAAIAAGIGPARLIFAERLPKDRHLQRLGLADLALDTRIYNGHVSSVDALWAGVPLVAMRGRHFAARVAASLLEAIGLPELIAGDLAGYESFAIALAADRPRLAALRARLADRRENSPLFDTTRFTRDLERALAEIWRRHLAGEPVRALDL
jgi:protein O-GlcNAc transferase